MKLSKKGIGVFVAAYLIYQVIRCFCNSQVDMENKRKEELVYNHSAIIVSDELPDILSYKGALV